MQATADSGHREIRLIDAQDEIASPSAPVRRVSLGALRSTPARRAPVGAVGDDPGHAVGEQPRTTSGSSTVHATTRRPRSEARSTTRARSTGSASRSFLPSRSGRWTNDASPPRPRGTARPARAQATSTDTARHPSADVRSLLVCARTAASRPSQRPGDADPVRRTVPTQRRRQRADGRGHLDVDREEGLAGRDEHVLEADDPRLAGHAVHPQPRGAHHVPRRRVEPTPQVGDPVEVLVVEGHQHAVRRDPHVGLERGRPEAHRPGERPEGVLRRQTGAAAVRDDERAGKVAVARHVVEPDVDGPVPRPCRGSARGLHPAVTPRSAARRRPFSAPGRPHGDAATPPAAPAAVPLTPAARPAGACRRPRRRGRGG